MALFIHWLYLFALVDLLNGFICWLYSLALFIRFGGFIYWVYVLTLVLVYTLSIPTAFSFSYNLVRNTFIIFSLYTCHVLMEKIFRFPLRHHSFLIKLTLLKLHHRTSLYKLTDITSSLFNYYTCLLIKLTNITSLHYLCYMCSIVTLHHSNLISHPNPKHFGRDHWVTHIYNLSLKKREKVPSSKSQTLTKERTCSFWGWIFGCSLEGLISSARAGSIEVIRILLKLLFSLFVCDVVPQVRESIDALKEAGLADSEIFEIMSESVDGQMLIKKSSFNKVSGQELHTKNNDTTNDTPSVQERKADALSTEK